MSEAFAILSACCAALSSVFLGELKGKIPLLQLVRWQMLAALAMTGAVSLALGGWRTVEPWQFGLLLLSGVAGIVVAGTAYVATIHATGPRITALLFSLTSPFTLCLGYLVLGETINRQQGFGVFLVLVGIALAIGIPRRFLAKDRQAPAMLVLVPAVVPLSTVSAPPKTGKLLPGDPAGGPYGFRAGDRAASGASCHE
jgi:drug/metabolite transporter (DMT)-like permease